MLMHAAQVQADPAVGLPADGGHRVIRVHVTRMCVDPTGVGHERPIGHHGCGYRPPCQDRLPDQLVGQGGPGVVQEGEVVVVAEAQIEAILVQGLGKSGV